jgi:broad specificity polyphosphatase/5'/3'-nucleotidase SurE
VIERKDPRGRPYYWMWGSRLPTFRKSSDVYAVHKQRAISISPLSLDLTPHILVQMKPFGARIGARIEEMHRESLHTHK